MHTGILFKKQILTEQVSEGPKILHFNKLPAEAEAAGPLISFWAAKI